MKTIFHNLWDGMNPIVVKELRQTIQGRMFRFSMIAFILALCGVFFYQLSPAMTGKMDYYKGKELFETITLAVLIITGVVFPFFTGSSFLNDINNESMELIQTTNLSGFQIARGKLISAVCYSLLAIALCLPFLTISYFLRGVDFITVLLTTIICGLFSMFSNAAFILFGAMPAGSGLKRVRIYFLTILACGATLLTWTFLVEVIFSNSGRLLNRIGEGAPVVVFLLEMAVLLLLIATAWLSPEACNRSGAFRVTSLVFLLLSLGAYIIGIVLGASEGMIFIWAMFEIMVTSVCGFFLINESDNLGPRIRKQIPRNDRLRLFKFMLTAGGINIVCFSVFRVIIIFIAVFTTAIVDSMSHFGDTFVFVYFWACTPLAAMSVGHLLATEVWPKSKTATPLFCSTVLGVGMFVLSIIIAIGARGTGALVVMSILFTMMGIACILPAFGEKFDKFRHLDYVRGGNVVTKTEIAKNEVNDSNELPII